MDDNWGAVIVCMILVLLIAGQFKSEPATAVQETTQADQTTVAEPMIESSEAVRETVKVETKAETTAAPTKDQTDETVQQIQPEVTKPAKPKDEDRHDPTKKPNGETVTPTNPVVAEQQPIPETEPPVVTEPQPGRTTNRAPQPKLRPKQRNLRLRKGRYMCLGLAGWMILAR